MLQIIEEDMVKEVVLDDGVQESVFLDNLWPMAGFLGGNLPRTLIPALHLTPVPWLETLHNLYLVNLFPADTDKRKPLARVECRNPKLQILPPEPMKILEMGNTSA